MSAERPLNGELRYAPVPVKRPMRTLEPRARLLPGVSVSANAIAAGGFVAGAVALVTLRAARTRLRRGRRRPGKPALNVVTTRSFLVDVHLLRR